MAGQVFDYARISVMRNYTACGKWPLRVPDVLKEMYALESPSVPRRWNPLRSRGARPEAKALPFYYCGHLFRSGTRPWEYPWVLDFLRDPPGQLVLDVGCGSSEFLFQYLELGHRVIGLDRVRGPEFPQSELTPEFVAHWRHLIRFLDADGAQIPLDDGSVDVVVCLSVLEHIVRRDDPVFHQRVLREFRRVLRPGGRLIMTCDTFTNPRVAYGGLPGWGPDGWDYAADIDFLGMRPLDSARPVRTRAEIDADEDTFFVPPDMYLEFGYGTGFELFGQYHRLTSIGYVLTK